MRAQRRWSGPPRGIFTNIYTLCMGEGSARFEMHLPHPRSWDLADRAMGATAYTRDGGTLNALYMIIQNYKHL